MSEAGPMPQTASVGLLRSRHSLQVGVRRLSLPLVEDLNYRYPRSQVGNIE